MALSSGEQHGDNHKGFATDTDGRLIVVGPGGVPIAGGGGGAPSGAVDITDRAARVLGTVVVAGLPAIALDAATLAALEQVGVTGTVGLDPASLAALETVQVGNWPNQQAVAGTVALDAATLAALESITATISNWPTTQPVSGSVNVGNFPATQPVSGPLTDAQLRAAAVPVTVGNFPVTQPTRDLKDTGRTHVLLSVAGVVSVTAETFLNLNINQPVGVTTGTTFTVPAGKTLRLQALQFGARFTTMSTTVTFANVTFRVRLGSAVTSPLLLSDSKAASSNAPTPNSDLAIPDGLELPAGTVLGVTQQASAATLSIDAILVGFLY